MQLQSIPNWRPSLLSLHLGLQIKTGYGTVCFRGALALYICGSSSIGCHNTVLSNSFTVSLIEQYWEKHYDPTLHKAIVFFPTLLWGWRFRSNTDTTPFSYCWLIVLQFLILLYSILLVSFSFAVYDFLCSWIFLRVSVKQFLSPRYSLMLINCYSSPFLVFTTAGQLLQFSFSGVHCCWSIVAVLLCWCFTTAGQLLQFSFSGVSLLLVNCFL